MKLKTIITLPKSGGPTDNPPKERCVIVWEFSKKLRVSEEQLKASLTLSFVNVLESNIRRTQSNISVHGNNASRTPESRARTLFLICETQWKWLRPVLQHLDQDSLSLQMKRWILKDNFRTSVFELELHIVSRCKALKIKPLLGNEVPKGRSSWEESHRFSRIKAVLEKLAKIPPSRCAVGGNKHTPYWKQRCTHLRHTHMCDTSSFFSRD